MPRKIGAGILIIHEAAVPELDGPHLVFFYVREEHTSSMFKPCYFGFFYYMEPSSLLIDKVGSE